MSKIWITRPELDATRFCDELAAANLPVPLTPRVYSLLEAEFFDLDAHVFFTSPPIGALVATSRNGVRSIAQLEDFEKFTSLPFFTVGEATGELARSFGFEDVRVGPGRAEQLLPLITEFDQSSQIDGSCRIVNLRGDEQSFDLKSAVDKIVPTFKHQFEDVLSYKMREACELSPELLNEIKNKEITAVVLMSPRTARIYCRLMKQYGFVSHLEHIRHFCLSEAVATELKDQLLGLEVVSDRTDGFPPVIVSSFPSQSHMIDCIKDAYFD
ncbi:MAG: uroporphyrinogen-III synthase [Rhizobiales bacterium]|nr:uroporphyrinogen-III synthase [Hyphomicrobiales bacterium]